MSKRKGEDSTAPEWTKVLLYLMEVRDTTLKELVTQECQD
jgi:hypothetical protein